MAASNSTRSELETLPTLRGLAASCAFAIALLMPGSLFILIAWSFVRRRAAARGWLRHIRLLVRHERKNP